MSAVYNFDEIFEGDSLEPKTFVVKRYLGGEGGPLIDLTGVSILFEVYRSSTSKIYLSKSTSDSGIQIDDAALCILTIKRIKDPGLTPFNYYWRLKITYTDQVERTVLSGSLPIIKFKERKYEHSCN